MYEACVLLPALSITLFGPSVLSVTTGMPMTFALLWVTWLTNLLPLEVYRWWPSQPSCTPVSHIITQAATLVLVTDALQYVTHRMAHMAWRTSHGRHHQYIHPKAADAFRTGVIDAVLQLLVPIYASLWLLRPCRLATSLFGIAYGVWLQWIHGDALQVRSWAFVTPSYHGVHHLRPHKNFGHVLRLWDWLAGTEECDYGVKKDTRGSM